MSETTSKRLLSLDVFRGITIAAMVLVNDAGDWGHVYEPLEHASWNGLTPTDLIFPFFMFIVGTAMTLSFAKRRESGVADKTLFKHVLIRSIIIFAIGVFLYAVPTFNLHTFRIMGVLQRIAVAYLIASAIYLYVSKQGIIWWIAGLLLTYWAAMTLIPVPGFGAGVITPEGNLSAYLDNLILGSHNYVWTKTWDPEGILSTVPSIATVLLGILSGFELRSERSLTEKITNFFFWGVTLVVIALMINPFFPINKNLWTSSYVLVTGGLAFISLAWYIYVIDIKQKKNWTKPFVVLGLNAIAAYVFASLLATALYNITLNVGSEVKSLHEIIFKNVFSWIPDPYIASASFATGFVLVTWLFAWLLYKNKLFIKV